MIKEYATGKAESKYIVYVEYDTTVTKNNFDHAQDVFQTYLFSNWDSIYANYNFWPRRSRPILNNNIIVWEFVPE